MSSRYQKKRSPVFFGTLIIVVISMLLTACFVVPMEDVSSNAAYSKVLGKRFKLNQQVWAHGIADSKEHKRIEYIRLVPGVGLGGSEVLSKEPLASGTILQVTRVLKARPPFSRIDYVVKVLGLERFRGYEVRIRLSGSINELNYGLDESVYSLVQQSEYMIGPR